MIASSQPTLLDQWRHRLGGRHRHARPRPFGALGYLTNGPVVEGLIEVGKLVMGPLEHAIAAEDGDLRTGPRVGGGQADFRQFAEAAAAASVLK